MKWKKEQFMQRKVDEKGKWKGKTEKTEKRERKYRQ